MREDTPSSTALLIARAIVLLASEPRYAPLVPTKTADACARFVRQCDGGDRFLRLCTRRWFRTLVLALERATLPGIVVHYALRKRALEETVRQSLAAGCRRVVVLGAGFDTLTLCLQTEYPAVHFLEIDHPATQKIKRAVLETGGRLPPNLALVSLDLGQDDLAQALGQPTPTVFVAEGLLMYLPPERVAALFGAIRRQCGPQGRFAFTFLEPQPTGSVDFQYPSRVIGFWLKRRREPFFWGVDRRSLPGFLESLGFAVESVQTPQDMRRHFLTTETPAGTRVNGDFVCVSAPIA